MKEITQDDWKVILGAVVTVAKQSCFGLLAKDLVEKIKAQIEEKPDNEIDK